MTGVEGGTGVAPVVVAAALLWLVVGAGAGAVLRAMVLARVAAVASYRVRVLGSAWANVPASVLAGAVLVWQQQLDLLPGRAPAVVAVAVLAVLGVCGGLSTWSTLALELSRSLLAGRRQDVLLQLGGVVAGVAGAMLGAGFAVVTLLAT